MVVQEEDEAPTEATTSKRSKYVVVKNHVRELLPEDQNSEKPNDNQLSENSNKMKRKHVKTKKSEKQSSPELEDGRISETDVDELKRMYNKCKELLLKMESKYGHLLDIESCSRAKRREYASEEYGSEDCSCAFVKKIIFDENGEQIHKMCHLENHICPNRQTNRYDSIPSRPYTPGIQVDYEYLYNNLPDSLTELENILKDPNIDDVYRKMVINKIFLTRQKYLSKIRYQRDSIIKQLKENPDELLDFKGTNISTLPGYPTQPKETES